MIETPIQEQYSIDQRVKAINEIKDKVKLLDKCQRKMEFASLDSDSVQLMMAAYEQLSDEINKLCRRVGL